MSQLMLTIFSGMSQFERDLISERTKIGLESARKRGRVGGRPKTKESLLEYMYSEYEKNKVNISVAKHCKLYNISKSTFYNYLKRKKN